MVVVSAALLAACTTVLGFPDRNLDETQNDGGSSSATDGPDGALLPGPRAAFATTALDFGPVPCGGAAPADQVLTVTNPGDEPLVWTASLSATPDFSMKGAAAGTIAPGESGTITVASAAVGALDGAGETAQAELTVTTNDPAAPETVLPIRRTAAGGAIELVPLTAAFGGSPKGVAAGDLAIALKNVGNQAITVKLNAPADPQFAVTWTSAPAAVPLAPGASVAGLLASFTPSDHGNAASEADIVVTSGATCGTNPTALTLTGKGTLSYASVQPGALDFGAVNCGTTAAPKTVKVKNSGAAAFTWNASLLAGAQSHYALSAATGSVEAGGEATVTVTPKPIPGTSEVTPNLYGDVLRFTTNAPGDTEPHDVDLLMTARGAILSASTSSVDFGGVFVGSTATAPFTVQNSGNVNATVSFSVGNAVFGASPQAQVVAGGGSYGVTATFSPTAQTTYSSNARMTVPEGTVLCAPLPSPIALAGAGASRASLMPSSLDFGMVDCGGAAPSQNVIFENRSGANFAWSASMATSHYDFSPKSGNLSNGKTVAIRVTPKAIPTTSATTADLYADVLTLTTTPTLESPYVASVHMTARGAILSFSPTAIDFGSVKVDRKKADRFSVVNSGNVDAPITLSVGGPQQAMFTVDPAASQVAGPGSRNVNATFEPTSTGTKNASVSVTTTAKRCAPYPANLTLTGTGTN
jgi:hypothetical protein